MRALRSVGMLVMLAAVSAGLPSMADAAGPVVVNTTSDRPTAGQCSLREAVAYAATPVAGACGSGQPSSFVVEVPAGHYVLTQGPLSVTGPVDVEGAGAGATSIDADQASQVLVVGSGVTATLNDVTVTGGKSPLSCTSVCDTPSAVFAGTSGGGIVNNGTLFITDSVVSGNIASAGAGGGRWMPLGPAAAAAGSSTRGS